MKIQFQGQVNNKTVHISVQSEVCDNKVFILFILFANIFVFGAKSKFPEQIVRAVHTLTWKPHANSGVNVQTHANPRGLPNFGCASAKVQKTHTHQSVHRTHTGLIHGIRVLIQLSVTLIVDTHVAWGPDGMSQGITPVLTRTDML